MPERRHVPSAYTCKIRCRIADRLRLNLKRSAHLELHCCKRATASAGKQLCPERVICRHACHPDRTTGVLPKAESLAAAQKPSQLDEGALTWQNCSIGYPNPELPHKSHNQIGGSKD